MFFATMPRRSRPAGLALASSQSLAWQVAQSGLATPSALRWRAWLSTMSVWQATHCILAWTLLPCLARLTGVSVRVASSLPATWIFFDLLSWHLRQAALSRETAGGGEPADAGASTASTVPIARQAKAASSLGIKP